jgi:hypothetical protein
MENILIRSPYYINDSFAGAETANLSLYLDGVERYSLSKNTDTQGGVTFEISELSRDYLEVEFYGSYLSVIMQISAVLTFLDSDNAPLETTTYDFVGFDGYGEFKDGSNPTIPSGALLQSNTQIYLPDDTVGRVPTELSNDILYNTIIPTAEGNITVGGHTIKVNRICEPKYDPIKMTFVNKFGVLQDLWFFKKTVKRLNTSRDTFKRNILTAQGQYNTFKHVKRTLNIIGNEVFTSNTGFVSEHMNDVFKELMLSEQVWATIGGIVHPIVITSSELQYKTSLNDKLTNLTIDFEYAYDTINNIR